MLKMVTVAVLATVTLAAAVPADAARMCRNSHGQYFKCHKVLAPRINFKAKHPIKVQRCRGHVGKFNNC